MKTDMKMPWTVRIVLSWFVLLAMACCVPLFYLLGHWRDEWELGWMVWQHVMCLCLIALGVGFVAAILCGRRNWVAIPYFLIGLFAFSLPITGSHPPSFSSGMSIYLVSVAVATVAPIVLLHLPSANQWFVTVSRQKKLGAGCCTLVVLTVLGMVLSMFDVLPPPRKMDAAYTSATALRGRNMFRLLMLNEIERENRGGGVDVMTCTNSCELIEELCEVFEDETGMATWAREWSFAVNLPPDAPDSFPLMISANVDPSKLPREWDGETDKDKRLDLPPLDGVEPLRFGNRAVVVVHKNGTAQVIRHKYMTLAAFFGGIPYKLNDNTYFLTPVGKRRVGEK